MTKTNRRKVAEAPPASDEAPDALHRGVTELFRTDDAVREAVATNLKERGAASRAVAERASAAFADFNASRLARAEREKSTYLAPGDDLARAMTTNVTAGVDAMRESEAPSTLRLALTDDLRTLLRPADEDGVVGRIGLTDLADYVARKAGTGFTGGAGTAYTACRAELEAERLLAEIEEDGDAAPTFPTADADAATGDGAVATRHGTAAAGNGDGAIGDGDDAAGELVADRVARQMDTATSPEGPLLFNVPQRSDHETRNRAVETFELRHGPSDVTSYHDFTSLQIAFPHVWTEIFDGELRTLGEELYREYVKLKVFAGDDGDDPPVSTLDDLGRLLGTVRELSKTVQSDLPAGLKPPAGTADTAGTPGGTGADPNTVTGSKELDTVVRTVLDPASLITDNIKDETVRAIVNPGGALIEGIASLIRGKFQITWDSFPGPLPGKDVITVTVEEGVADPGTVEIAIRNSPQAASWKGITHWELDESGRLVPLYNISNDPRDPHVWDRNSYNVLPIWTTSVANSVLEFGREGIFGVHTGLYLLGGLEQKLTDRTRVTFTWM